MKQFIVLEEVSGISKKNNPYHMIRFADASNFANHTLAVDQNFIKENLGLQEGQKITLEVDFKTDFRGTNAIIQRVNVVK